ncbi:MAG: hypothetical protein WC843_03460 [Candidatus Gracilibacteria bacterium]|jgi:hypothetical protein
MKTQWLNISLKLSNRIYEIRQKIIKQTGLKVIVNIFILFLLETFLALVSLPFYLSIKPDKAVAYMKEHGTYEKVTLNYNLRRVVTLAGLGVVLAIWVIKLLLIVTVPYLYGPLPLYRVSSLSPTSVQNEQLLSTETGIQTAQINNAIIAPIFKKLEINSSGNFVFTGTAQPLVTVVLMISAQQDAIYYGQADDKGQWQIEHSQAEFKLNEGNHSLWLYSFNPKTGERSQLSEERYFKLNSLWLDVLIQNVDNLANWSLVLIIAIGLFSTFLIF